MTLSGYILTTVDGFSVILFLAGVSFLIGIYGLWNAKRLEYHLRGHQPKVWQKVYIPDSKNSLQRNLNIYRFITVSDSRESKKIRKYKTTLRRSVYFLFFFLALIAVSLVFIGSA